MNKNQNKGFGMLIVIAIIAILIVIASGFYLINSKKEINTEVEFKNSYNLDKNDYEEDDSKEIELTLEPITKDDSYGSIESDLNNTVIIEEDFSDL